MAHIFKALKEKTCQFRILYLVKISIRKEGEIKIFSAKGICYQEACSKIIVSGSSVDKREMIPEGDLEH